MRRVSLAPVVALALPARAHGGARRNDIDESDDVTTLDIVRGAASIADALDKLDYVRAIADQDRRIARAVATAKRQVTAARARTARIRATVHQATRAIEVRASQTR